MTGNQYHTFFIFQNTLYIFLLIILSFYLLPYFIQSTKFILSFFRLFFVLFNFFYYLYCEGCPLYFCYLGLLYFIFLLYHSLSMIIHEIMNYINIITLFIFNNDVANVYYANNGKFLACRHIKNRNPLFIFLVSI